MSITGKIVFTDNVEFTTTDVNSNKFLIYYRENGELIKFTLPLTLIKEFTYIDEKEIKKCPICDSSDILIPESINPIEPPEMKDEDITYFDGINDPLNWECLKCGANKVSLEIKEPEIIPDFKPRYGRIKREVYDDKQGHGNLRNLKINGKRYREVLHWFKIPVGLKKLIGDNTFIKTMPIFKYYEKDYYIYLEYLWYVDEIQHKPAISDHLIDDCRVSARRYLKPPKHFNREILKYKYPDLWNLCDATYKWEKKINYVTLQIKWSKKKYYENYNKNLEGKNEKN